MDSEKIIDLEWALSYADERASEGNASTEGMRILAAEVRRLHALAPELLKRAAAIDNGYPDAVVTELRSLAASLLNTESRDAKRSL